MKILLPALILCCSLIISNKINAQDFSNSGEYMGFLHKQQDNITKRYLSYTSASAHGKREKKVEALRSKLLDEIQEARMNISGMPSWKGDKSYRDTAVSFMKFYYNVMNDDYAKIINMEELAERSYDEMEAYILLQEAVEKKLAEGNERMRTAEKSFADRNEIKLVEGDDEKSQMMKEVNGLNKHYHEVYLIFFKPTIQEKNLLKALDLGNLTAMEQNRSAMLLYAREGLVKLKSTVVYNGDNSLVRACAAMLNFYVKEADKAVGMSEYFIAKEKFEAAKKDAEKKDKRTKEDVDNYNKAVGDINKASERFNSINKEMNEARKDQLKEWNETVKDYFDRNTPHYK